MILIIEDDTDIRDAFVELIDDAGHKSTTASNGAEALTLLQGGLKPSLILCDLTMPVMDGATFRLKQLENREWAEIPTIILTAGRPDRKTVEALKPTEFMLKPVDFEAFLGIVDKYD